MNAANEQQLEQLLLNFSGIQAKINILESFSLPDAILSSAQDSMASLIVMGTVSKYGLETLILGSMAETIIRKSICPVLTTGPHVEAPSQDPLAFRTIIYATNFSEQAAKEAIYALSFAQDSGAYLYLRHILRDIPLRGTEDPSLQTSFINSLRRLIPQPAYDWCNPECIIEHGDTANAILSLADRVHADLIVLGARKSSFWLDYIETGVTPAILASAKCPVLTVC